MMRPPFGPLVSAMGPAVTSWGGGRGEARPTPGLELCAALLLGGWLPNMAVEMGWSWTSGDLLC